MAHFEGFRRKAVVVIPPHHELRKRTSRRNEEMGTSVPLEAINAMKGVLQEEGGREGGEREGGRQGK